MLVLYVINKISLRSFMNAIGDKLLGNMGGVEYESDHYHGLYGV